MKKLVCALLCAVLLVGCAVAEGFSTPTDYLGQPMPDFTVTTITGETFTLSEALQSKKAVMVNLWATWCGPCENEFPYIEEAYEMYSDDVAIIALSVEPTDSDDVLTQYAEAHGMTFDIANDAEAGMGDIFVDQGIPTTVLVDRFGNVCLISVGSMPSVGPFQRAFELLISDDYTETVVMDEFPPAEPPQGSEEGKLAAAAGLTFYLSGTDDPYAWPFDAGEDEDGAFIYAANIDQDNTSAQVQVNVLASEGDAFAFQVKTSCEVLFDYAAITVNGETVRKLSGESDWIDYAVMLEEGWNTVVLSYSKDTMMAEGDDTAYFRNFRLLPAGDEAAQALAAVETYPYADETYFTLLTEGAQQINLITDDPNALEDTFGTVPQFWIVNGPQAEFAGAVSSEYIADEIGAFTDYEAMSVYDLLDENLVVDIDTLEETGYSYSAAYMVKLPEYDFISMYYLFADEANATAFVEEVADYGFTGFEYVDGTGEVTVAETADATETETEELPDEVTYTVSFVDEDGNPVADCYVNFCTDEACTMVPADENGVASYTGAPYAYHVQVLRVAEGYTFDAEAEYYTDPAGDDVVITLTKAE